MIYFFVELGQASRRLIRAPGVTISVVLCLTLGLGVNGAMLSVLDALLVRPPAQVRDAGAVRRLYRAEHGIERPQSAFSFPLYSALTRQPRAFSGLAAYFRMDGSLGRGQAARRARIGFASTSFFSILGVQAVRGRLFSQDEGPPERPAPVALVSWELAQRTFPGTEILGKPLRIGRQGYIVVGVLPPRFTGIDLDRVDVWLPLGAVQSLFAGPGWWSDRGSFFLNVVGRLKAGVPSSEAAAEASLVLQQQAASMHQRWAAEQRIMVGAVPWGATPDGAEAARLAVWLAAASGAVFLIACANVASLLIVRGLARQRELVLRLALGARRFHVIRLVLTESMLLAFFGAVAAYAALRLGEQALVRLLLPEGTVPPQLLDPRQLAILTILAFGAGLLSGLSPAWRGSHQNLTEELRGSPRTTTSIPQRARSLLACSQITFTCALLIGAGLFARSLWQVSRLRLGLDPDSVLVVTANLGSAGYDAQERDAFFRRSVERVRRLPGVERASLAAGIPFRSSFGTALSVPGRGDVSGLAPEGIYLHAVGEDYLETLGTRLIEGRTLSAADDSGTARVAVVNRALAHLVWPGLSPLGRCVQVGGPETPCFSVVGVVEDARRARLLEASTPQIYVPLGQNPLGLTAGALFVRTKRYPEELAGALRHEIQSLAAELPFIEIRRLSDLLAPQLRPWRVGTALFTLFAFLALALAMIGVASTVAVAAASRTPELAIRLALGASSKHVLWQVLRQGLGLTVIGVFLGILLAEWGAPRMEPFLFRVAPHDPRVVAEAAFVLVATACVACLVPALRVLRITPAVSLKTE